MFTVIWFHLLDGIEETVGPFATSEAAHEHLIKHSGGDYSGYVVDLNPPPKPEGEKRYSHLLSVAFSVELDHADPLAPYDDRASVPIILAALQDRVRDLANLPPSEAIEAFDDLGDTVVKEEAA